MDVLKGLTYSDNPEELDELIDQMEGQQFVLLETLRNLKKDYDDGFDIDHDYRHKIQHQYNLKKLQIKKLDKKLNKIKKAAKKKAHQEHIAFEKEKSEERRLKRETHQNKIEIEANWFKRVVKKHLAFDRYLELCREAESLATKEMKEKGLKIKGRTI